MDEFREEREKIKDASPKQKWKYFKDYYLLKVLIVAALLVVAVMIPIELKFGTEKGRMMIFAIFAIVMVAIVGGGKALAFIGDKIGVDYQAIMMKLQETPMLHVQLILYAAVIVLFVISAAASNAIMAKKEY